MCINSDVQLIILGAIIALFSSIVVSIMNNNASLKRTRIELDHQKFQNDRQRKLQAGEELYQLFSKWSTYVTSSDHSLTLVMEDKIDYNKYLDNLIEAGERASLNPHKIELLIRAYFPQVESSYKEVREILDEVNEIKQAHKHAYKVGEPGFDFIEPFLNAKIRFGDASNKLKKDIALEIQNLDQTSME